MDFETLNSSHPAVNAFGPTNISLFSGCYLCTSVLSVVELNRSGPREAGVRGRATSNNAQSHGFGTTACTLASRWTPFPLSSSGTEHYPQFRLGFRAIPKGLRPPA